ncbi:MAG TPA: cytochrome c [Polyangiaceae bacterium]|nr:cytochrome c [Polyangiaceae bacterium]
MCALAACSKEPPPAPAPPAPSSGTPAPSAPAPAADAKLAFVVEGRPVRELTLAELRRDLPTETLTVFDPYYKKPKTFRALRFADVWRLGFDGAPEDAGVAPGELLLRAKDGYTVPLRPPLSTEPGAYLAYEDVEVPGWEPIGPQRANPAPFYLVWREPGQQSLETHPRPWQLATIERASFERTFPHTVPTGEPPGSLAFVGFGLFRDRCARCHAINREGGRVGPELNVPKNVLEYRTAAEVKAYVRDPLSLRYGNMPPHPDLREADLDALVGYLAAMKTRKFDPDGQPKKP